MENFINENNIILNLETEDKREIINKMTETISEEKLLNKEKFIEDVFKREEMENTVVGFKVAIPHGKSEFINSPQIVFAKLKEEIFPTLNLIQQFMKTKEHSSLKIELFDCETEQDPDVDNMSVLVNADNNFTAKFVYNYHNETYSTTITKTEEKEYEIDDLTEAYAVFSNIFPYNEWEVVNDPIYNWIEENK